MLLYRGVRPPPNECPDMTQKIWWWGSCKAGTFRNAEYPFIAIPPCQLWLGVVVPDMVPSMGQIELNCVLNLNWSVWNRTVSDIETVLTLNWIV